MGAEGTHGNGYTAESVNIADLTYLVAYLFGGCHHLLTIRNCTIPRCV